MFLILACYSQAGFQGPDPASAWAHLSVWLCKRPRGNKIPPGIKPVAAFPTGLLCVGMHFVPQGMSCRGCSPGSRFRTQVCNWSTFHCLETRGLSGAGCRRWLWITTAAGPDLLTPCSSPGRWGSPGQPSLQCWAGDTASVGLKGSHKVSSLHTHLPHIQTCLPPTCTGTFCLGRA